MKRTGIIALALAIALIPSIFAQAKPAKVKITMSGWLETEAATEKIFKEMIADFEAKNPDIDVETVGIPFNQYKDQVLIASTAGNAPDVIMGNSQMMIAFHGAGLLAEVKGAVQDSVIADVYPANLAGCTFEGTLRAISWVPHPIAMYYNKELFAKAGLDPDKAPKTWDEMVAAAYKVAALKKDKDGNDIFGLAIPNAKVAHTGGQTIGVIYAFGGEYLDKDGRIAFDNKGTREVFSLYKKLVQDKVMVPGVEIKDIRGLFAMGRVGIAFDGDFGRDFFRTISGKGTAFDATMGEALIPVGRTGRSETVYTEHQLGISSGSKQKAAAARLVEYLLGKDAMLMYHKSNGYLSARKSIAALPGMNEDSHMKLFNRQSETARPLPATKPVYDKAMNEITKSLERVLVGGEDMNVVIPETQKIIADLYSK